MAQPIVLPPAIPQPLKSAQGINPMLRSMQQPLPVRVSPNVNPRSASPYQRAPVGATFNGIGAATVADAVRMQKDSYLASGDGYPITGPNYVQKIRKDAAGQLYIAPPRMPTAGYAAAFYNRPNVKMKVGAALQGAPFRGGTIPPWVKRSQYYIPESPAAHRRAQMATLMGLGAIDKSTVQVVGGLLDRCCIFGENCSDGEDKLRDAKIQGVREKFKAAFGFDPTDEQVQYYASMKWCVYPNSFDAGDKEANFVRLIGSIASAWKASGQFGPPNPALITPGPDQFPGGPDAFKSSFAKRGGGGSFSLDEIYGAVGGACKALPGLPGCSAGSGGDAGGGSGGSGGGSGNDTPPPQTEQSTDYTPYFIGVAVAATLFLAYKALQKTA